MLIFSSLYGYIFLISAFFFTTLLPGYFLTRLLLPPNFLARISLHFGQNIHFFLRRYFYYLFAPALGLILLDFVILTLDRIHITLGFWPLLWTFLFLNLSLGLLNYFFNSKNSDKSLSTEKSSRKFYLLLNGQKIFLLFFLILWLASLTIRVIFYLPDSLPQDTDLGHHMYFSQLISQKEKLPVYNTSEVIVGEHLIFATLSKLSGVTLLSSLALIILAFYNLMAILSLSLVALLITNRKRVALLTLFFSGIYLAVDPPQAKFAKGGVIGNTFGNLFTILIILIILIFFRYFIYYLKNKTLSSNKLNFSLLSGLFSLFSVLLVGSFYTHHLTTLLILFSLLFAFLFFFLFPLFLSTDRAIKKIKETSIVIGKILISPRFLITLFILALIPLFIYLPFYLEDKAVSTVIGTPIKDTRIGVALSNAPGKLGLGRLILAIIGITLSFFYLFRQIIRRKRLRNNTNLILWFLIFVSWFFPLFVLSFYPQFFYIDLPSQRIINYLIFPLILFAASGAHFVYSLIEKKTSSLIRRTILILIVGLLLWDGTADFRSIYASQDQFQATVELFHASAYLAKNTSEDDVILKDHRSLTGDSWIKFFFLRGYDYFLSRTYDYKYNDVTSKNPLDPCPREMITVPESSWSQKCYGQTQTNYVILKPQGDEYLFWKDLDFRAVYLNNDVAIFAVK